MNNGTDIVPYFNGLAFIRDLFHNAVLFFKSIPDYFTGAENYYIVLLALFVVGTLVNLITGEDDDL